MTTPLPTWWPGPLLGFDTETTGVDIRHDRIVTAALVRRDQTGTDIRMWMINPGVEIPAVASAIHGITTERAVAEGCDPRFGLDEIAHVLVETLSAGVPVVAFNARFDLDLLDTELARHGLATLPERLGHPTRPILDPLVLDRALAGDRLGPRTLGNLCEVYEVVQTGALHSADIDVIATLDVLERIVERHPELTEMTADSLHDQQTEWAQTWRDAHHRPSGSSDSGSSPSVQPPI